MIRALFAILMVLATQVLAQPPQEAAEPPEQTDAETAATVLPRVTAELTPETALVGQPLVLRVKVLVPTWLPQPPAFPSMEAPNVIVRLPERASGPISEVIEGETWSGVSRAYRLYPMVPGEVVLPEQNITVVYADPATTQPVTFEARLDPVRFTATVPKGAEGLDPLIFAEGLTLEQTLEGGEGTLKQGDAVIRSVTAKIAGTSALFIPPLVPVPEGDAVRAYPEDPIVKETEDRGVLSGSRTEVVSYVAQYGGVEVLPQISIDWFNTASNKVETTVAEAVTLEVDAPAASIALKITARQIAVLVGAALLLALLCWAITRFILPPLRRARTARHEAWLSSEEFAAGQVEAALAGRNLSGVVTALALWSPRAPGDMGVLEPALAGVGAGRYGPGGSYGAADEGWNHLRAAFLEERRRRNQFSVASALPPLNPV